MKRKIFCILIIGSFLLTGITASAFSIETNNDSFNKTNNLGVLNYPPSKPIVNGPEKVKKGESFSLLVKSVDPDGDDIYYESFRYTSIRFAAPEIIIWGPYPSGVEQTIGGFSCNGFGSSGSNRILIRAIDIHDAHSEQTIFEFTVSRSIEFSKFLKTNKPTYDSIVIKKEENNDNLKANIFNSKSELIDKSNNLIENSINKFSQRFNLFATKMGLNFTDPDGPLEGGLDDISDWISLYLGYTCLASSLDNFLTFIDDPILLNLVSVGIGLYAGPIYLREAFDRVEFFEDGR